jgi:hypothetical protein
MSAVCDGTQGLCVGRHSCRGLSVWGRGVESLVPATLGHFYAPSFDRMIIKCMLVILSINIDSIDGHKTLAFLQTILIPLSLSWLPVVYFRAINKKHVSWVW